MGDEQNLDRLVLISSTENDYFAQSVSDYLGKPLARTERKQFADGDILRRISEKETVRDRDVYLIETSSSKISLAERLQEAIIWTDALISGAAKKLTFVLPYMPGARQDRKNRRGEPINIRAYMRAIEGVAGNRSGSLGWMTVDLHSSQSQQLSLDFDPFTSDPLFATHLRNQYELGENLVTAAADPGGVKLAIPFGEMVGINYAGSVSKVRESGSGDISDYGFSGKDLDGKTVILREDMIDTAGTLETAERVIMEAGAERVIVYATHLLLNDPATERLSKMNATIIGTDTYFQDPRLLKELGITILPASYLIAEAIRRKHLEQTTRDLHTEEAGKIIQERFSLAERISGSLQPLFKK